MIKRLERIIEIKERKKEKKEIELKEVMQLIKKTEDEIMAAKEEYKDNYKKLSSGFIDGSDFYVLKDYLFYLENKERELIDRKHVLIEKANGLKEELISIYKEIKKLETLKEKARFAQRKEELKRLQKRIDEFALKSKEARL